MLSLACHVPVATTPETKGLARSLECLPAAGVPPWLTRPYGNVVLASKEEGGREGSGRQCQGRMRPEEGANVVERGRDIVRALVLIHSSVALTSAGSRDIGRALVLIHLASR